jgi:hypothetical protein
VWLAQYFAIKSASANRGVARLSELQPNGDAADAEGDQLEPARFRRAMVEPASQFGHNRSELRSVASQFDSVHLILTTLAD